MMAGNPNWWNMHPPSLIPLGVGSSSSSSSIPPLNFLAETHQEVPTQYSWSQMLFAGLPGEEERMGMSQYFETKKLENWEEEDEEQNIIVNNNNNNNSNPSSSSSSTSTSIRASVNVDDVIKQEVSQNGNLYGHDHQQFQMASNSAPPPPPPHASISYNNWSNNNINNIMVPLITSSNHNFSPNSRAISSLINNTSNVLDFTYHKKPEYHRKIQPAASQCNNSTSSGGVCNKKARVHSSPSQPPLKVRKEKLGDRITALHQLVSPFGKTDTASVLLEAIGYIRFLQTQIQALSSPYLTKASKNMRSPHSAHGERNAVFPEDPGQLLNDTHGLKRKGATISNQDGEEKEKDLRSRGLCLVPVSCTQHVGSENGADYWAPTYGNGF